MNNGIDDNGAYNRMTRTLPNQPSRCTDVKILYEQPNYALFLKSVKAWIRSCVQEGRENELLDNNASLEAVWDELQQTKTPMALNRGRSIQVIPHYEWERTSGPPFWRATKITFTVQKPHVAPPYPQYQDPSLSPSKPTPVPDIPPKDYIQYYYCSEAGVRSISVKRGVPPPPQADAKSQFFLDQASAQKACGNKPIIPGKPPKLWPGSDDNKTKTQDDDSEFLDFLRKLTAGLFIIFGSVIFVGKLSVLVKTCRELYGLQKALRDLLKKDVDYQLDHKGNRINLRITIDGKVHDIGEYLENLRKNGVISQAEHNRLRHLYDESLIHLQELELERINQRKPPKLFFNRQGLRDVVRGYFIEDNYIEKRLMPNGYIGLPDFFKGFDAYKEGATYTIDRAALGRGKYIAVYDNPGLVSIKSYQPKTKSLKDINFDYLDKQIRAWKKKMDFKVFEKKNIRIVNPKMKEIHLILVGNESPDEYGDIIAQLWELEDKLDITLSLKQYRPDTGSFVDLGIKLWGD
jgi:hypothetical protein